MENPIKGKIRIYKDVPIPQDAQISKWKTVWNAMEVGDSVIVSYNEYTNMRKTLQQKTGLKGLLASEKIGDKPYKESKRRVWKRKEHIFKIVSNYEPKNQRCHITYGTYEDRLLEMDIGNYIVVTKHSALRTLHKLAKKHQLEILCKKLKRGVNWRVWRTK